MENHSKWIALYLLYFYGNLGMRRKIILEDYIDF